MIFYILLLTNFLIYTQSNSLKDSNSCEICIVGATCADDKVSFNISIKSCDNPMSAHFTYYTDVHPKPYHYNTTSSCSDCYITIDIDPVRDAWDYTLTLKLPETSKTCATQYTARCGGEMFQLSWFILGGLSLLAVISGAALCFATYYRSHRPRKVTVKKKKPDVATINV